MALRMFLYTTCPASGQREQRRLNATGRRPTRFTPPDSTVSNSSPSGDRLPPYAMRVICQRGIDFSPDSSFLNGPLYLLSRAEQRTLGAIGVPFGSTLMVYCAKCQA